MGRVRRRQRGDDALRARACAPRSAGSAARPPASRSRSCRLSAPDSHGAGSTPFWPDPQRLADAIALFAGAGFQCATHTIGDAAARFVLDAYARAGGGPHRLEHLETLPDDMIGAIARAGVVASMQPIHLQYTHGNWAERLGPERAARAFRTRDLLDAGAPVTLGSDWPVADADPLRGLAAAVHRSGVTPEQALTPLEALHGYTTTPARVVGERGGRIAPGLPADLTGLVADPVDGDPEAAWLTVVGGRVVYGDLVASVNDSVFA
jgi:predicted amidohydrolase YtcJ